MSESVFVIGGCRSGKSRNAEEIVQGHSALNKVYIATCQPLDDEMEDRITRHQADRGEDWKTVEEPIDLTQALKENAVEGNVILVDCLTLWITNLVLADHGEEYISERAKELAGVVQEALCPIVLVSNEVGAGIVPENALARRFRDVAGRVNQAMAGVCTRVVWVVAGIPVVVKEG